MMAVFVDTVQSLGGRTSLEEAGHLEVGLDTYSLAILHGPLRCEKQLPVPTATPTTCQLISLHVFFIVANWTVICSQNKPSFS